MTYTLVVDNLSAPVALLDGGDGSFYIVEQTGYIYNIKGNQRKLLIDISKRITPLNPMYDERGLLNMIFHPSRKNIFYLYYTIPTDKSGFNCEVILEEWILDDLPHPNRIIFQWLHPETNHFGSPIGFSSDGLLYVGTGDGGGAGDNHGPIGNAQNDNSPWGKILTINVDLPTPLISIYAKGFRNPWRSSFAPDGSIIVGEVGQDEYEGIHLVRKGENHGWRAYENGHVYDRQLAEQIGNVVPPVLWYGRAFGRAVIGGYQVAQGYIFGDFTGGIHADNVYLIIGNTLILQPRPENRLKYLSSFAKDSQGNIYALFNSSLGPSGKGAVYKININS